MNWLVRAGGTHSRNSACLCPGEKLDVRAAYFLRAWCLNSGKRHAGSFSICLLLLRETQGVHSFSPFAFSAFVLGAKLLRYFCSYL